MGKGELLCLITQQRLNMIACMSSDLKKQQLITFGILDEISLLFDSEIPAAQLRCALNALQNLTFVDRQWDIARERMLQRPQILTPLFKFLNKVALVHPDETFVTLAIDVIAYLCDVVDGSSQFRTLLLRHISVL